MFVWWRWAGLSTMSTSRCEKKIAVACVTRCALEIRTAVGVLLLPSINRIVAWFKKLGSHCLCWAWRGEGQIEWEIVTEKAGGTSRAQVRIARPARLLGPPPPAMGARVRAATRMERFGTARASCP